MRIGINARLLLKDKLEGLGWFTYETVRHMSLQHPEDTFFLFFDRSFDESFVFGSNVVPIEVFPQARHPLLYRWWFEWSLPKALRRYEIDVFYSPDNFCSLSTTVPTVLVVHDLTFKYFTEGVSEANQRFYERFMPKFLMKADKVLTVSKFVHQDILKNFKLKNRDITICYNGCRAEFVPISEKCKRRTRAWVMNGEAQKGFLPEDWLLPEETNGEYFLYVGSIHPRKNVNRLIEAFDIFKRKTQGEFKLVIAGRRAWGTDSVEEALKNMEYREDVMFLDYVSNEDLPKLVGSAFAMVYVSLFEGFGVPILEAMNADVPVITSNVSSMPEVAGDAALLINPIDVIEIADAMQQLFENPTLREKLVENGRQQRQKFDWKKTSEIVYDTLVEVSK
jgi:glycosyltransferase involved in cell wall biosynthesis